MIIRSDLWAIGSVNEMALVRHGHVTTRKIFRRIVQEEKRYVFLIWKSKILTDDISKLGAYRGLDTLLLECYHVIRQAVS